ncbi:MAG: hypothetical protein VB071_14390 [Lawsonibacter sp.]|nr:hypothetical protein [Lawsonibacter sp.]
MGALGAFLKGFLSWIPIIIGYIISEHIRQKKEILSSYEKKLKIKWRTEWEAEKRTEELSQMKPEDFPSFTDEP